MRSTWFSLLFLLTFPNLFSYGASLSEYVDEVVKANPNVMAARLTAEAARLGIDPASSWEDPFVAIGRDEIPVSGGMGYMTRYQISQTIPFPGKNSARSKIATYQAESASQDAETVLRQIKILATQIYFKAYLNQKALELNKNNRDIVTTITNSLKARYKSGASGHHEWVLSQVESSILEVEKLKLLREKKTLQALFNELRNKPSLEVIGELSFDADKLIDKKSLENDFSNNQPELKSLDYFINQTKEEERLAKLSYFPDFVLQGMMMEPSPEMMEMGEKKTWGFMVGVSIPLYFWRKQNDLVQSASASRRAAEFQRQSLYNRLSAEWTDAQEQLKTSKDVVELYRSSVIPSTNLAVKNARTDYAARRLPLSSYLNTLKIQRTQEIELIAAEMDLYLAHLRAQQLLSNPPLLRLSPGRPSLFGIGEMGSSDMDNMASDNVNMGGAMKLPTTRKSKSQQMNNGGGSMEGM